MPLRGGRPYKRDAFKKQVLGVAKRFPSTCPRKACEHPALVHGVDGKPDEDICTVLDCPCGKERA